MSDWRRISISGLALATLACHGTDDDDRTPTSGLEGMYQMTSVTLREPCDGPPAAEQLDPPYFEIASDGAGGILAYKCTGPAPATCDEAGIVLVLPAKPIGGGIYRFEQATTIGNINDGCSVDYFGTEVERTQDGVSITTEYDYGSATGNDCGGGLPTDGALARFGLLPCGYLRIRLGTRL